MLFEMRKLRSLPRKFLPRNPPSPEPAPRHSRTEGHRCPAAGCSGRPARQGSGQDAQALRRCTSLSGHASGGSRNSPGRSCGPALRRRRQRGPRSCGRSPQPTPCTTGGCRNRCWSVRNMATDLALDCPFAGVGNHLGDDLALALQHPHNGGLVEGHTAFTAVLGFAGLVHVEPTTADVGLIRFDFARELAERACLHSEPDAMKHEPTLTFG